MNAIIIILTIVILILLLSLIFINQKATKNVLIKNHRTQINTIVITLIVILIIIDIVLFMKEREREKGKDQNRNNPTTQPINTKNPTTNPTQPIQPTTDPSQKIGQTFNSTFDFKNYCYEQGGVLDENLSDNNDDQYTGTLLECTKMDEYGVPLVEITSEIQNIIQNIQNDVYVINNEEDRLKLYFSLVYPIFQGELTLDKMIDWWNSLELYFLLPKEIMPQTEIVIKRKKQFFQAPKGAVLDQIEDRPLEKGAYIEVFHNGANNSFIRPYKLFNSTWYYPVKGSGIWIPTGNMLIANNKIHALKLLNTPNTDILQHAGYDFVHFLTQDSQKSGDQLLTIQVVDKNSGVDPNTGDYKKTRKIHYSENALNKMIEDISNGQNIRQELRRDDNGKVRLIDVYYGISDTGDKILAQIARNRGYDTVQLLREPQMGGKSGVVNVGTELMHLYGPIISQSMWLRLDPFKTYDYDYPIKDLTRYQDKDYINRLVSNTSFVRKLLF